jgi:HAE1 family hydrophobic/amphiphilic exporter-1
MRVIIIRVPEKDLAFAARDDHQGGTAGIFVWKSWHRYAHLWLQGEIFRRNQSVLPISADLASSVEFGTMASRIEQTMEDIELPPNYQISVTGQEEQRRDAMSNLLFALMLSVVLVYMVDGVPFESCCIRSPFC